MPAHLLTNRDNQLVILFRYICKEIVANMFTVSFLLLIIVMSARFVKYLAEAAAGDLAPEVVFAIIAYRIPSFLELLKAPTLSHRANP